MPPRSTIIRWLALAGATIGVALGFSAIGFPSPTLFAALLVGVVYALAFAGPAPLAIPHPGSIAAQALIGISLGAAVDADTLKAVGQDWAPVLLVTVGTLGVSLAAGLLMARFTGLDKPTACLGLIAGGASGIVAMADELGADGRMVAFMQYLRVLVIVVTAPLLAHLLITDGGSAIGAGGSGDAGLAKDLAFTAVCAIGGVALGRLLRFTASALLMPLLLAAAASISGLAGDAQLPDLLAQLAFATIGLQVGLRFTMASLREVGRLLVPTLLSIVFLIVACAGLALLLLPLTSVTFGDAYLATTPGGLYAILAAAASLGGNTTFVVAVQALRVFVMVLAAPPLVRLLVRDRPRSASR